jgi:hypothetical protein
MEAADHADSLLIIVFIEQKSPLEFQWNEKFGLW